MANYQRTKRTVEADQYNGPEDSHLVDFVNDTGEYMRWGDPRYHGNSQYGLNPGDAIILTPFGPDIVHPGDWVMTAKVRCKPELFDVYFEPVDPKGAGGGA